MKNNASPSQLMKAILRYYFAPLFSIQLSVCYNGTPHEIDETG